MSQQGRRKSVFPGNTALPADTTLDFVSGGANYKITLANFLAALGVTGTIVQDGDVTGTPILDPQGAVNNIRNLEVDSNSGLKFTVSAENGIYAELDAQSDGDGVAILASDNTIRRAKAGSGMAISVANGDVVFSTTDVPGATRVVVVNVLSDFPTPSAGVIPLAADTIYYVNAAVDVDANTFSLAANTVVTGLSPLVTGITSSATGTLFLNSGGFSNEISHISVTAPSCTIIGLTFATSVAGLDFHDVTVVSCASVASITRAFQLGFSSVNVMACSGDVFKFFSVVDLVNITTILVLGFTGTVLNFGTAVLKRINVDAMHLVSTSGSNKVLDGAASSANITATGLADVHGIAVEGSVTASSNILSGDLRWWFTDNTFIADSTVDALLSMQANATDTAIAVAATPVLVAGAWTVEDVNKMAGTTAGRGTYNDQSDIHLGLLASVTAEPASGGAQTMAAYFAVNGTIIANSKRSASASPGAPASITLPWDTTLSTSDYVEVWVANDSSTNDVLVSSAVLRVG